MSDYENDAYKAALYGRATEEQQRSIAAGVALRQAELATLRATIARLEGEKAKLMETLAVAVDHVGGCCRCLDYASDELQEQIRLALAETGEKP